MENVKKTTGRTQNFTALEKSLLTELVEMHKEILENKRTDNATCKVGLYIVLMI